MIRESIKKIVNNLADNNYSGEEIEQMEYALTTIFFEAIKIILLIIIFSLFGYLTESIIITLIMCSMKPFIGGYHEETQIKCFIATLLLTAGMLILSLQVNLNFFSNCILILLSTFGIWNQAPVINSKMPITRPELIKKNRIRGLTSTIVLGLLSIVLYNYSSYYSLITWTILFHAVLMFNKREE